MSAIRRAAGSVSVLLLGIGALLLPVGASARTVDPLCAGRGPIPASALAGGVADPGCSLVGRLVVSARGSAVVPPDGISVTGEGVTGRGEVIGIRVSNLDGVVTAAVGPSAEARPASYLGAPGACKDHAFALEGPKWTTDYHWRVALAHHPRQIGTTQVVQQLRRANANMRLGRNTCGKPRITAPPAVYDGRTGVAPNIKPARHTQSATCTRFNHHNSVGFGDLHGYLLGWTCYWSSRSGGGQMMAADVMLDSGKYLVTHFAKGCADHLDRWDFQGIATHEFGHVYGLAHTGPGHDHLTMQHLATACSTYQRTLGLGDWLGMNKLYGH